MHVVAAEAVTDWVIDEVIGEPYVPAPTCDADLDADPEPDSITPGYTLRLHQSGAWAVLIHGEHHAFFNDFEDARQALAAAEAEWAATGPPECERRDAFTGHPAAEGGAE